MKRVWLLMMLMPASALAASGVGGYLQQHLDYRIGPDVVCGALPACSTMANEQRLQLLGEWRLSKSLASTVRVDAINDLALRHSSVRTREAYLDWTASKTLSIRAGRQVITWGVADYLFVNDVFPKNYDGFFSGKPFDHMKAAVDAVKFNALLQDNELEWVIAKPAQDDMPLPQRFISQALPAGMQATRTSAQGGDFAMRLARKIGDWDGALYLARYHSRDAGLYFKGNGLQWAAQSTRHLGASATGSIWGGVGLIEMSYSATTLPANNMNRFFFGKRAKVLVGYARDIGADVSISLQYLHELEMDYAAYQRSLAPMVSAAARSRQTLYARVQGKFLHQSLSVGAQLFAAQDGGKYFNPFVSYALMDGLNLEVGSNWFAGPTTSPYGMMKQDSNLYTSLRYSF